MTDYNSKLWHGTDNVSTSHSSRGEIPRELSRQMAKKMKEKL